MNDSKLFFLSSFDLFLEVSPSQLKKPSMENNMKECGDEQTNLMKTLLKQRPKRVSHLLQDNLPNSSTFINALWQLTEKEKY